MIEIWVLRNGVDDDVRVSNRRIIMGGYPVTMLLLVANVVYSYIGFTRPGFLDQHKFQVDGILRRKEYLRILTGSFLHGGWVHLIFNMLSLYYVGRALELYYGFVYGDLGFLVYLGLYGCSMVGGDALALLMHRNDGNYSAVGASGAISGLMFALVVLNPNTPFSFFFIPMPIWLFAILFIGFSLFGMRSQMGRIGHDAHLGGALAGLLFGCLFALNRALDNWILIVCLLVPTLVLIYLFYHNPVLGDDPLAALRNLNWGFKRRQGGGGSGSNNRTQVQEKRVKQDGLEINMKAKLQAEMDGLLEKVHRKGIDSLSATERKRLDELARYLNRSTRTDGGRAPRD
jgi:membrane associated rhomboid family serine protease